MAQDGVVSISYNKDYILFNSEIESHSVTKVQVSIGTITNAIVTTLNL